MAKLIVIGLWSTLAALIILIIVIIIIVKNPWFLSQYRQINKELEKSQKKHETKDLWIKMQDADILNEQNKLKDEQKTLAAKNAEIQQLNIEINKANNQIQSLLIELENLKKWMHRIP